MARLSYVDPATISDPQIRAWLDQAVAAGRPGPENQAIRAHNKVVMRSFTMLIRTMKGRPHTKGPTPIMGLTRNRGHRANRGRRCP